MWRRDVVLATPDAHMRHCLLILHQIKQASKQLAVHAVWTRLKKDSRHHPHTKSENIRRRATMQNKLQNTHLQSYSKSTRALLYPRGWRLRRSQPATKPVIFIMTSFSLWRHSLLRPGRIANRHISGRYRQRQSKLFSLWRHWRLSWPRPALQTYGHLTTFNI